MDNNVIKAFRQRLRRHGFKEVSIYDNFDGTYVVRFLDLDSHYQRKVMSLLEIQHTPHLVWFD